VAVVHVVVVREEVVHEMVLAGNPLEEVVAVVGKPHGEDEEEAVGPNNVPHGQVSFHGVQSGGHEDHDLFQNDHVSSHGCSPNDGSSDLDTHDRDPILAVQIESPFLCS
jgi:hypothetical protein